MDINTARKWLLCLAFATQLSQAQSSVEIIFIHPENYTDTDLPEQSVETTLKEFERHIKFTGAKYLHKDAHLKIEVLDIDLAGEKNWWLTPSHDARILRDVTWPNVKLRYRLEAPDAQTARNEESISQVDYLTHFNRYAADDPLRYEKNMLDDWFAARFATRP